MERLEEDEGGDFVYTFTRPWSDGTTGIKLAPLEWCAEVRPRGGRWPARRASRASPGSWGGGGPRARSRMARLTRAGSG